MLVTLAMLAATPSSACSMVAPSVEGPFFTGDGWAFLHPTSTQWGNGLGGRLVFYDALGGFVDETEIELRTSKGHAWVVRVDSDRSTWWRVRCDDGESLEETLCGRLVKLGSGGEIELSVPVPSEEGWRATVRGQGFVWGRFVGGELVLQRLDVEATLEAMAREPGLGKPVLEEVRRLAVPAEWVEEEYGRGILLRWAMNGEGSVAAIAITQDGVRIRRWDEDDALLWDRKYERARPGHATPEGRLAIGEPWLLGMAGDGSLVMTGWQYHADCSPDRPPGMLVLGPDGELRAEVAFESRAWGLALDDGDGVAVDSWGTRVFDLDGHERARFAPTSPGAEAEEAAFQAKIESLGPDGPVADWIDIYGRSGHDEEIAGWLASRSRESATRPRNPSWRRRTPMPRPFPGRVRSSSISGDTTAIPKPGVTCRSWKEGETREHGTPEAPRGHRLTIAATDHRRCR